MAVADAELADPAGVDEGFERAPHAHRQFACRQRGVQHKAVEVIGLQVTQGRGEGLPHLGGQRSAGVVGDALRILAANGGEFRL